ncbi:gluconate:H+ symporter [Marinoscillum furvescens]|uniref:Gnt-I system high-affinity gluconate transporter n=1 Tax=Marinoscillum furvescens DSM 4134 TaxID=1122208 RepID=A0A3D9L2G3_MARFU|nr:gluconate:H+ symporter [Marinoscillum furvescens]RED96969.1 Gnt-I system high-affinity gluconate transporter [Marinoscillum furvescens DSM 4134]
MSLLTILFCIVVLVLLITWGKVNPFLAFIIVSLLTGIMLGVPLSEVTTVVENGIGGMLGGLVIVIVLGAMLGKLVAESGAAQSITNVLMRLFGTRKIQWALMTTGFVVGIPLFYNVGFVLLVPLIFSVAYQYKLKAVYIGLPMLAALSVTHGFLPPHPSPTALVGQLNADMGLTLIYGFCLAIPAIILAGPVYSRAIRQMESRPLSTFQAEPMPEDQLPGGFNSFFSALLPVLLLVVVAVWQLLGTPKGAAGEVLAFVGNPSVVMIIALIYATFSIGIGQGKKMKTVMNHYAEAIKDISPILLIVAGAGALKQVFVVSGVSTELVAGLQNWNIHPLVLGWLIAGIIRVCIGSATVAGLTAAGILAPVMQDVGADPNLMVLSVGAGSLLFSHVNDSGFWMYKEYFNLSVKDTIKSWSVMETIVSVVGLIGVLILDVFL